MPELDPLTRGLLDIHFENVRLEKRTRRRLWLGVFLVPLALLGSAAWWSTGNPRLAHTALADWRLRYLIALAFVVLWWCVAWWAVHRSRLSEKKPFYVALAVPAFLAVLLGRDLPTELLGSIVSSNAHLEVPLGQLGRTPDPNIRSPASGTSPRPPQAPPPAGAVGAPQAQGVSPGTAVPRTKVPAAPAPAGRSNKAPAAPDSHAAPRPRGAGSGGGR